MLISLNYDAQDRNCNGKYGFIDHGEDGASVHRRLRRPSSIGNGNMAAKTGNMYISFCKYDRYHRSKVQRQIDYGTRCARRQCFQAIATTTYNRKGNITIWAAILPFSVVRRRWRQLYRARHSRKSELAIVIWTLSVNQSFNSGASP